MMPSSEDRASKGAWQDLPMSAVAISSRRSVRSDGTWTHGPAGAIS